MKQQNIYREVEEIVKENKLMEKRYNVKSFPKGEPYFTTSQETDIFDMIRDGLNKEEIILIIKQW